MKKICPAFIRMTPAKKANNSHDLRWATLTMLLLVVMAVCIYLLLFKHTQVPKEQIQKNDGRVGVRENFFPNAAPLYL